MKYQSLLRVIPFLTTLISTSYSATPTSTPTSTPTGTHFGPTWPNTITVNSEQASAAVSAVYSVSQTWINGAFCERPPFSSPTAPRPLKPAASPPNKITLSEIKKIVLISPHSDPSIKSAVFTAAPTDAQLSLAISGYNWDSIVKQPWYQTGVPTAWQSYVNDQEVALQSALDEAIGWSGSHKLKEPSVGTVAVMAMLGVGIMMWL